MAENLLDGPPNPKRAKLSSPGFSANDSTGEVGQARCQESAVGRELRVAVAGDSVPGLGCASLLGRKSEAGARPSVRTRGRPG